MAGVPWEFLAGRPLCQFSAKKEAKESLVKTCESFFRPFGPNTKGRPRQFCFGAGPVGDTSKINLAADEHAYVQA